MNTRTKQDINPGKSHNELVSRLPGSFFTRDVLEVAPQLLGKFLVRRSPGGTISKYRISETEAYRGINDKACHAHKGKCSPGGVDQEAHWCQWPRSIDQTSSPG